MGWASELLGPTLIVKDGSSVVEKSTDEYLAGKKKVLLYFSASWCPPCKVFTPILAVCYEDAKGEDEDIEIVYVSSDFDKGSFDEYWGKHQPWAALPFNPGSKLSQDLGRTFGVRGIPTLVALDGTDGGVITTDARSIVSSKKTLSALDGMAKGAPAAAVRGQADAAGGDGGLFGSIWDLLTCGCGRRGKAKAQ